MENSQLQTPVELISIDQTLIDSQPPESRRLLQIVMALVQQLLDLVSELHGTIATLKQTIANLQQELNEAKQPRKTSRNSSIPPSTEHPHAKPKSKSSREPTGKPFGGQIGHHRHERTLIPTEKCSDTIELPAPEFCRRCGGPIQPHDCQLDPIRHQVWDVPEIKPVVIEYRRHRLLCDKCDITTAAPLPENVPVSTAGPQLLATTAVFLCRFRGSRRLTAEALSELFHIPASASWIVKQQDEITSLLRPIYDELVAALPRLSYVNADETPYKEGSLKSWLWAVCGEKFTVYALCPSRQDDHIQALLGEGYTGTVMCDRAKMYQGFSLIQWCWAHLRRDFVAISEAGASVGDLGQELVDLTDELFSQWHLFRGGTISRSELQARVADLRIRVEDALHRGVATDNKLTAGRCRSLLGRPEALWVFASEEGVEPTNNAAERAIRPLVILRRLTYGTQSPAGSRFVETVQTIVETCRQQSRNVIEYITDAIQKARLGQPLPSLLTAP